MVSVIYCVREHIKLKTLIRFRGLKDFKCNSKEFGIFLALKSNASVLNRTIIFKNLCARKVTMVKKA